MSFRPRLIIPSLFAVTAIAVAAWFALGISSGPVSAQGLLENAQAQNATVESYKFTMDFRQTRQMEGDPLLFESFTEATVVFGTGMHVVVQQGDSHSESLLLHGRQYDRDSAEGDWVQFSSSFDSSRMPTLDSTSHFQIVNDLIDASIVGEETLDGLPVTKTTGRFDTQEKAQSIWGDVDQQDASTRELREQMVAGSEDFVAWVGIEDGWIHAYEVTGSYPRVGEFLPFSFWYRVEFSEFDQSLELPSVE